MQSCSESFLDIKPEKSLVVPSTLDDYLAILDNINKMNFNVVPYYGEVSSDDYFLNDADWETLIHEYDRNAYIWNSDLYGGLETSYHWNRAYQTVFYANVALEGAKKHAGSSVKNMVVGSALFYRAWVHYWILSLFAKQYDTNTAKSVVGIPLRLESDINVPSKLSTIQESYDQIIHDLHEAVELLPDRPSIQTRPSKLASYALLSRIMLQIGDYTAAQKYAESALAIQSELLEYSSIDGIKSFPFQQLNKEVIFDAYFYGQPFNIARYQVDPGLHDSFLDSDLRKELFFFKNGNHTTFRGSYNGSDELFCGLAIDELYLITAECLIRNNLWEKGMEILNDFLKTRIDDDSFQPLIASNMNEALNEVLRERRKQLMFRGIRWLDLKRLNKESEFASTLERIVKGKSYRLEPNSTRYVFPFPPDVKILTGF